MAKVGRPRKAKNQKVEYQLIAVHTPDYKEFIEKADNAGMKKVEAFHDMVQKYQPQKKVKE
jgi:hypothetical protein